MKTSALENSSTVATRDDEEQSSTSNKENEEHQSANEAKDHTGTRQENTTVSSDTSATNITIGKDSAGFENKQGAGVSIDTNGIKATSKKVKVNVKTRGH